MNEALALTAEYFRLRAISDEAFIAGNGALSTGTAFAACLIAERFQSLEKLKSTDEAVQRMRQLRSSAKEVDC
jgi:hypothetical protein